MRKKIRLFLGIAASAAVLFAGGYLLWCNSLEDEIIWADYEINGISLMGMTRDEALNAIEESFVEQYEHAAPEVVLAGKTYKPEIFPMLSLDAEAMVEEAYLPGHRQWYKRGIDKYRLRDQKTRKVEILPEVTAPKLLEEILADTGIQDVNTLVESTWEQKGDSYVIHEGRPGVAADMEALSKAVLNALENHEYTKKIQCPVIEKEPQDLFPDVLGSYDTYGAGTKARIQNISLAAEACNDVILMPGEEFSYNEALGERTTEKGYGSATVYINGKAAKGIGGGICQVSSTLFAALLHTDLEITRRANHSLTVGYLPLGMDAAVSWGGPDLCFRNNTDYPLKISMTYERGRIKAQILGTKEGDYTVEPSTENVGELAVKTYRNYYDKEGTLLKTEEAAYSQYRGTH